jgi:hypothetical protein
MTEGQEKSTPQPDAILALAREILATADENAGMDVLREHAVEVILDRALRSVAGGEPEQWISADYKPELNAGRVLTSVHGLGFRARTIGLWDGEEWKFDRAGMAGTVTHWRELPAPPQGKEQK